MPLAGARAVTCTIVIYQVLSLTDINSYQNVIFVSGATRVPCSHSAFSHKVFNITTFSDRS